MVSSKTSSIRYESELAAEFANLVSHDTRLEGIKVSSAGRNREATLAFDGRRHRFALHYLLAPTLEDIPGSTPNARSRPLLVVPRLSDAFLDACRQRNVSVVDLNGKVFLRDRGLLISLSRLPGRDFRFGHEPRNVFVGKSVRIVRALLADPERPWRQADLVTRTGATSGLVSRIVTYLTRSGMLKKIDSRRFQVSSPSLLLDAWAEADDFKRRTRTYRFTGLDADPLRLAKEIRNALADDGTPFAFTQWIAAWLRHPYTEPPMVSVYVSQIPPEQFLGKLGLRPVDDVGRVWFHVPSDEGLFLEKRVVQDLPLVSDAQIYVDLQETGLRGPEQAKALRDWSGFCRP